MNNKKQYTITAIKLQRNDSVEHITYKCEAYTEKQAEYMFKQKYGYTGIRDMKIKSSSVVSNHVQLSFLTS